MPVCSMIGQLGGGKFSHHSQKCFVAANVQERLSTKARQLRQFSNIILSRMISRIQSEITNMHASPYFCNGYKICHPNTNVGSITKGNYRK